MVGYVSTGDLCDHESMSLELHWKALDSFSETMYPYQYRRRNGARTEEHGDLHLQGDP